MAAGDLILAIDQGTTSSRAIVFDETASIVAVAQREFPQLYPAEGWVEHDPEAIWETTLATAREAMALAERGGGSVVAIGVTNQRETTLVWDRETGRSIYNAIVWQDRRTAEACRALREQGFEPELRAKTGLLLDPYFSATKLAWILDHVEGARLRARAGRLAFGTVDTFLLWRLTGGAVHATDATNASRTNLYNIIEQRWDPQLLERFGVEAALLPEVRDTMGSFGATEPSLFGRAIPILAMVGDQQAAAVGQGCFSAGDSKSTYGTGCFLLVHTGAVPTFSSNRLLTTIAWQIGGKVAYALEGSIFNAGAAVQWLRDGLGIIAGAAETEGLARGIADTGGVYLVPAFTGMGAPYWDPDARGAIYGLTRATGKAELARAALEAVCFQTNDLLRAVADDGVQLTGLKVDGGMVANDWLMQRLADVIALSVERPKILETTALGAAYLAGSAAGVYGDFASLARLWQRHAGFVPSMPDQVRAPLLAGWADAVRRTRSAG